MPADQFVLKEVEQTAAKFASRHLEPVALDVDHADPKFPEAVFVQGLEAGFDQLALPEDAGGSEFSMLELCVLLQTLSRTCAGHAMVFGVHAALVQTLFEQGPQDKLVELLKTGQPLGVVFPDPAGPDDFEGGQEVGLVLNAKPEGNIVLFTKTAEQHPQVRLVPGKTALGAAQDVLGLRAMPIAELGLSGKLAESEQIAEGPQAMTLYGCLLRHLSLVTAACASGLMAGAYQKALDYAAERYQGGKIIIDHSHLRSILGVMAAQVSSSHGSVLGAASQPGDNLSALSAKVSVTGSAVRTCTDAVQVLGGYGYMHEYGLEKAMRDAAVLSLLPISNARAELLIAAIEKKRIS